VKKSAVRKTAFQGETLKTCAFVAALLFAVPVVAQQPAQPTQQLTGHILSAEKHRSHHATTIYSSTGESSNGGGISVQRETDIQIGKVVYGSSQIHNEVQVGKDYPVEIETDKHGTAKKLDVIVGDKKYTYRIAGMREVKSN
jgi:hypothetical protein